jgi:coproporphyrinogen III oxidase-like Fe-S oxidoreductase
MGKELSIYLHWPFCKSKCPYCDFFSQVKRNTNQDEVINGYIEQLNQYKKMLPDKNIASVFFILYIPRSLQNDLLSLASHLGSDQPLLLV